MYGGNLGILSRVDVIIYITAKISFFEKKNLHKNRSFVFSVFEMVD